MRHIFAYFPQSSSNAPKYRNKSQRERTWPHFGPKTAKNAQKGVRTRFFFDSGRIARARAQRAQRIPGPQRGPLENFRPFERAQEIFHRGARPIKSSMGKPKLGRISRSAYNRSLITLIMILLQRITFPYVRPKPANVRPRRYLGPVADQGNSQSVSVLCVR